MYRLKHVSIDSFYVLLHWLTFCKIRMTNEQMRSCVLENYDLVPYLVAWEYQKKLLKDRLVNPQLGDRLILLEHPAVYTLGKAANIDFLNFDPATSDREVYRIERGGEVTYHCPGQLVAYPILNLKYYQQDLHWYLRRLEEVVINVMRKYDLDGYRIPGLTGVWLEDKKIAAIGIKVRRWITMHGFAINVSPDLAGFQVIVPCGIKDKLVGSLVEFKPKLTLDQVKIDVVEAFAQVFQVGIIDNL